MKTATQIVPAPDFVPRERPIDFPHRVLVECGACAAPGSGRHWWTAADWPGDGLVTQHAFISHAFISLHQDAGVRQGPRRRLAF